LHRVAFVPPPHVRAPARCDQRLSAIEDELAATRKNPHDPDYQETILSCLHVILEEEWEHHRFAVRDLEAIEAIEAKSGE